MKRYARIMPLVLTILAAAACEPEEEKVAQTDPEYERSLIDTGLRPMGEEETAALLNDSTVYATYALTEQKRIEYFDSDGVVVQTRVAADLAATDRPLLFGSWWVDGEKTCFAYGSSRFVECYRLYYREGSLLFIPMHSSPQVPAGALLAYSTDIRKGNSERFPLLGQ